jgi:hypothetical protein
LHHEQKATGYQRQPDALAVSHAPTDSHAGKYGEENGSDASDLFVEEESPETPYEDDRNSTCHNRDAQRGLHSG